MTPRPKNRPTALSGPSEAQFQDAVLDLARRLGVYAFHVPDSRRCPPGWPDLTLVGDGGLLFRELKTARGRVRPEQAALGATLTTIGQDWALWRPADLRSGRVLAELQAIRGRRAA